MTTKAYLKLILFSSFLVSLLFLQACKKEAGQGGVASISGYVFVDTVFNNKNNAILGTNQYMPNINVYLCYGNDSVPSDNAKSSYNGQFTFNYLQKGKYTVFVSSDNMALGVFPVTNFKPFTIIKKEITISDRKGTVDAGTFHINYAY